MSSKQRDALDAAQALMEDARLEVAAMRRQVQNNPRLAESLAKTETVLAGKSSELRRISTKSPARSSPHRRRGPVKDELKQQRLNTVVLNPGHNSMYQAVDELLPQLRTPLLTSTIGRIPEPSQPRELPDIDVPVTPGPPDEPDEIQRTKKAIPKYTPRGGWRAVPVIWDSSELPSPRRHDPIRVQITFRNGSFVHSPQLTTFRKKYPSLPSFPVIITALKCLMERTSVKKLSIWADELAIVAAGWTSQSTITPARAAQLIACIVNKTDVTKAMQALKLSLSDVFTPTEVVEALQTEAEVDAATRVQSVWRGAFARKKADEFRSIEPSVALSQRIYRTHMTRRAMKANLAQRRADYLRAYDEQQTGLNWSTSLHRIHLPSLSVRQRVIKATRPGQLDALQNQGMTSSVVGGASLTLITPMRFSGDLVAYLQSLCADSHLIFPENTDRLPSKMSLTLRLLCSPRALERVHNIGLSHDAIIQPGPVISKAELEMAGRLGVPMLGPRSVDVFDKYCGPQGARLLCESAGIPLVPGAIVSKGSTISDVTHMIHDLQADHPRVSRWLVRLGTEHLGCGVGVQFSGGGDTEYAEKELAEGGVAVVSGDSLDVTVLSRRVCSSIDQLWIEVERRGCVVQALPSNDVLCPVFSVMVLPSGEYNIGPLCDPIHADGNGGVLRSVVGWQSPSVLGDSYRDIAAQLAEACSDVGLYGQAAVRLVDGQVSDVEFGTKYPAIFNDAISGINDRVYGETRPQCWLGFRSLYNASLGSLNYPAFQRLCAVAGLVMSDKRQVGSLLLPVTSFVGGRMDAIGVGPSHAAAASELKAKLSAFLRLIEDNTKTQPASTLSFTSVISMLRKM